MSNFIPKRVTRTYTQHNSAPPAQVFPLLCPVRETEWLEDWRYRMVWSESGIAEKNCIFITQHPGMPETIWVTTVYQPENYHIEYVEVTPDQTVVNLNITLEPDGDAATLAHIAYTYTGLSESGNARVEQMTQQHYDEFMIGWQNAINHYLQTGTLLRTHHG